MCPFSEVSGARIWQREQNTRSVGDGCGESTSDFLALSPESEFVVGVRAGMVAVVLSGEVHSEGLYLHTSFIHTDRSSSRLVLYMGQYP